MYRVNIRKIGKVEKFIEKVEKCRGSVYLGLPNQTFCDLKKNKDALQMLYMINPKEIWLELYLTDAQDSYDFMSYIMGVGA